MIVSAVARALSQMGDPAFRRVMGWTLLWTILVFLLLAVGVNTFIDYEPQFQNGWLNFTARLTTWVIYLFAAWFLFPLIATTIMGFFLDDAAAVVEEKHYTGDPPGVPLGMFAAAWDALKLGLFILFINILALPLYLLAFLFPLIGPMLVYYAINGYLLGREYYELVALRHLRPRQARELRRAGGVGFVIYGLPIAIAFSIPFVNLVAPLFGTAYMVHVFKSMQRTHG